MKNLKIYIGALIVTLAIVGGYFYPNFQFNSGATNNAAGTKFNSAKVAQVNISLATTGANATSTSISNTDSTDRIVQDFFYDCNTVGTSFTAGNGTGLANLVFTVATTSTASPNALGNTNLVAYSNVSTSTPDTYAASTTIAVAAYGRIWAAGSNLTFFSNATNTAVCTVGVHYLAF